MLTMQPGPESLIAAASPRLFREGMSRIAGAVHLVTTDGPAGRGGFTATAVTPVTDAPPSLLVCVNTTGRSVKALLDNGVFCVNALAYDDLTVADVFSGRLGIYGEERFATGAWARGALGLPLLLSGLVSFECRVSDARIVATHHVLIGEIAAIRLGDERPALVYRGRHYRELE
jgi:flavin reductase (DIM6/NTAB) family NADH-FMN oxidoreductase RutF